MKLFVYAGAFLAGTLSLGLWRELPATGWYFLPWLFLPLLLLRHHYFLFWLLAGHLWAALDATAYLDSRLLPEQHRQDFRVTGRIATFPSGDEQRLVLELLVDESGSTPAGLAPGTRLRLNWYHPQALPSLGESWSFLVRLKVPSGMLNAGAFDYERWLFARNISATGSIRGDAIRHEAPISRLSSLREQLRRNVSFALDQDNGANALVTALLVGDRSAIDSQLREYLQHTGTSHLIAISGLHVGLAAGASWYLVLFLWGRSVFLMRQQPAPVVAAAAAIVGALCYAALAGFSIPTQRAVIMTAAFAGASMLRLHYLPIDRFALALIGVLLLDPRSAWQAGFWLSFMAVLLLVVLVQFRQQLGFFKILFLAQLFLTGIMYPVQMLSGLPLSVVSPLVNLFAVPWFSFVLVPGVLLSAILSLFGWFLPLELVGILAGWTLDAIRAAASLVSSAYPATRPVSAMLLAILAVLFMASTKSWRMLLLFAALYSIAWVRLPQDQDFLRLTVFDVGQGQSILLETRKHNLLYDLGPAYPGGFNTAETVLLPYLRSRGIERIDRLIVSHDDRDHAGGMQSFLSTVSIGEVLLGQRQTGSNHPLSRTCQEGMEWEWDGITFEVLHPGAGLTGLSDNDMSCTLLVRSAHASMLLTGDITRRTERMLLAGGKVPSDLTLLTVPHHGSRSSSHSAFVQHTRPGFAIVSAGWKSHFGHPAGEVVTRWEQVGAEVFNTAETGMLKFTWRSPDTGFPEIMAYRQEYAKFWNR